MARPGVPYPAAGGGFDNRRDLLQVHVDGRVFHADLFQKVRRRTPPDGWYIDRAFNDVNSPKAAAFLANLARRADA
jgi:hypothetical protein